MFSKFFGRIKKMKTVTKVFLAIGLVLLIAIIVGVCYIVSILSKVNTVDFNTSDIGIVSSLQSTLKEQKKEDSIINIALFGIDSRTGEQARSDAIMILTIDNKHGKLKVSSIMRDSYVNIDGRGMDKINHAYFFGGPELAVKTINQNFGLNITDFASVEYEGLAQIIDAFGGITLSLTPEEVYQANLNINEVAVYQNYTPQLISGSGELHLNGQQAVGYARIRAIGGDFQRTDRQREVLEKVLEKVFEKAMNLSVTDYPGMISKLLPLVKTSLTSGEVLSIGTNMVLGGKPKFEQARFPMDVDFDSPNGSTINGIWYLTFDLEQNKERMQKYIFDDVDPKNVGKEDSSSNNDDFSPAA